MFDIIAVGLTNCLELIIESFQANNENKRALFLLSEKGQSTLFRLLMRSFTDEKYNKVALEDWSVLF